VHHARGAAGKAHIVAFPLERWILTRMQTAIDDIEASWKGTEREGTKVEVTSVKCDHIPVFSARDELEKWMEGLFEKCKSHCGSLFASTLLNFGQDRKLWCEKRSAQVLASNIASVKNIHVPAQSYPFSLNF
jgi:hypothetical protein